MGLAKHFIPKNPGAKIYKNLEDIPAQEGFLIAHKHKFDEGDIIGNDFMLNEIKFKKKPAQRYFCQENMCVIQVFYCPNCEGYIEGEPHVEKYDDIGVASGSSGVDYSCDTCGENIARLEVVHS